MVFTVFDIIMARSLRSLAGFCMGEYRDFEPERNISYNYSDIHIQIFITFIDSLWQSS